MAVIKPDMKRIYAVNAAAANIEDPDNTTPGKYGDGWALEVPMFQHMNFIQNLLSTAMAYLNEQGVAEWDLATPYPPGAVVKKVHPTASGVNQMFVAKSLNTNKDPYANSNIWASMGQLQDERIFAVPGDYPDMQTALDDIVTQYSTNSTIAITWSDAGGTLDEGYTLDDGRDYSFITISELLAGSISVNGNYAPATPFISLDNNTTGPILDASLICSAPTIPRVGMQLDNGSKCTVNSNCNITAFADACVAALAGSEVTLNGGTGTAPFYNATAAGHGVRVLNGSTVKFRNIVASGDFGLFLSGGSEARGSDLDVSNSDTGVRLDNSMLVCTAFTADSCAIGLDAFDSAEARLNNVSWNSCVQALALDRASKCSLNSGSGTACAGGGSNNSVIKLLRASQLNLSNYDGTGRLNGVFRGIYCSNSLLFLGGTVDLREAALVAPTDVVVVAGSLVLSSASNTTYGSTVAGTVLVQDNALIDG